MDFTTDDTVKAKAIEDLPYRFIDVHKLDKQDDIKLLQYGSRLDKNSSRNKEELFTVKRVISPELVELNNNMLVRLIGIRQDITKLESAVNFMLNKFSGRKVFLKKENVNYGDGHLSAYIYLDNKTFINAHLLKYGYAFVDLSKPFAYMDKFIKLKEG